MKTLTLIAALSLSVSAFSMKHADEHLEKACYSEALKVGCVKKSGEADVACVRMKKAKITKTCHPLLGAQ